MGPRSARTCTSSPRRKSRSSGSPSRSPTCESRSAKDKEQILQLKTDLAANKDVFQYAGRSYSKEQVKVDLANRFQRYKTVEATLGNLEKIHDARERSLEAARQKLEGMLAAKRQLVVEVENLEAQRQMVAAAKTTSNYEFDDSQLGRVKALIADLQVRLDTETETGRRRGHLPRRDPAWKKPSRRTSSIRSRPTSTGRRPKTASLAKQ